MFKVVDNNLTTIFNKVQDITTGVNLSTDSVNRYVDVFNKLNSKQAFGHGWEQFLNGMNSQNANMAAYFEDLAKQGASARANIEGVYAAILDGNTRGIGNVKSIISTFNSLNSNNQKAFASAVGQTNAQLGNYLSNIQHGTASFSKYSLQLVATTAKTFALKAATIALNTALVVGISWLINKGFQYLSEWYKSQKELQELAIESAQTYKEQTDSMKDLVSQYETILDSEKTDAEKTVELNKWKQTLVETYKIERDELRKLNTDREYGIQLLEDEIDAVNSRNRNKWLGENKEAVDTAISKINSTQIGAFTIDDNSIYDNIKQYVKGSMGGTYSVIGDNLIEQYDNLEKIIEYFGSKSELSTAENDLLKKLNKEKDKTEKILDEYRDNYETYYQYTAQNLLDSYAVDDKAIENVSQETYEAWKNGLIATANGDKEIEKALSSMLEEQFPDYETYFSSYYKNLAEAQNKFVNSIHVNSQDDAVLAQQISEYIGSLDEQDLSILLTFDENAFDEGIGIVKRKIAKFKEENPVEVNFKISDYQEQLESVSGNIKTLQDALDKLDSNEFDFTNDIYDLANAFPEYSTEILNASGDTEQLRKVLQELLNSQPNDLIKSLTALKSSLTSEEDIKAVDNLINILRNSTSVAYSVTSLSDSLQDLSDKESILSTVWKEMNEDGHISISTYKTLCEMGDDYADTVTNTNGVLTTTVDEIKKVIQKNYDLEIATKRAEMAQLQYNAAVAGASGDDTSAYVKRITQLDNEIKAKEEQYQMLNSYDYTSDIKDKDDPWKDEAESKIKEIQHLEAKGEISHEEYINRLDAINQKYFANNEKYLDDFNKYDEEIYKARKDREQDLFDQKIENLDKEKEKALENNDFSTAKTSVNTQITETRKRIVELKTSGKQDVDDEIKQLEEDLDNLNDTLNDINSQEYEFNISIKEDSIEDLEKEFEKSGDTSIYDKQIGIYTGLIADAQDEINRLLDLGYSKESDEIQELVDQIEGYSDDIADIWEKQTDVIKDNVDEQIEALDRSIENTGDTKLYSEKIKVYKDGQQQILDMIEFYRKQGYAEDSAIIKKLKKQWNDYQDSISDALQEQANAQVEAYNELLDEQIELLEQQKESQDEYYDNEIKALEAKKSALEEVNEEIEKENELEQKRQSIAEAERNLYKNVRLVYTNGQWVQKAREEDLQSVKDAEKDLSDTLRKQEIEAIENQITATQEAKDEFDETIDKQINALKESESNFEKAMEKSYKVRQQLDYEFISAIVGDDKAKEYQTNADNALKAIAESEQSDNNSSDNTNTQTDNSALINSNNTVAETNQEVADSNVQLAESNSKLGDIQGEGTERNVDTIDTQESTKTETPSEIDSETLAVFNNLLKKANVFLKDIPIEEFNKLFNNDNLKSALDTTPQIADDVDKSKMVMNVVNNVTNAPVITTTVTVNGNGKSDEELANIIATTTESKVTQALGAFVQGATNRFTKMMYGNT